MDTKSVSPQPERLRLPLVSMTDMAAGRVQRDASDYIQGVSCVAHVHIQDCHIRHDGPVNNYRPYMYLWGELRSLDIDDDDLDPRLENIASFGAKAGYGPMVSAYYSFTDKQLFDLVNKGYFTEDFHVPNIVSDVIYEFPVKADILRLEPNEDYDVPLTFVEVRSIDSLNISEATTGYDLSEYFDDVLTRDDAQPDDVVVDEVYDREIDDVFANDAFIINEQLSHDNTPSSDINDHFEADSVDVEAESDDVVVGINDIYEQIIQPHVDAAFEYEQGAESIITDEQLMSMSDELSDGLGDEADELDLGDDESVDTPLIPDIELGAEDPDEKRRRVEREIRDIERQQRNELEDDGDLSF